MFLPCGHDCVAPPEVKAELLLFVHTLFTGRMMKGRKRRHVRNQWQHQGYARRGLNFSLCFLKTRDLAQTLSEHAAGTSSRIAEADAWGHGGLSRRPMESH